MVSIIQADLKQKGQDIRALFRKYQQLRKTTRRFRGFMYGRIIEVTGFADF
jgi:hypothetical protein